MSVVIATVRCGDCVTEGSSSPGKLGEVRRWPSGLIRWGVEDRRGQQREMGGRGQKLAAFDTLRHPRRSDYAPPEWLPAFCERGHGAGHVSTADIVGKSGSIVLKLATPRR